jgi:HPt (histidine-containing phosphotransfer) domain-containing protein
METVVPQILDLNALRERFANDEEIIADLLEVYLSDTMTHMALLGDAISQTDLKTVTIKAHSLKGISANMSLEPLREVFLKLEAMGKQGDLKEAPAVFQEAQILFEQFQREYGEYKGK